MFFNPMKIEYLLSSTLHEQHFNVSLAIHDPALDDKKLTTHALSTFENHNLIDSCVTCDLQMEVFPRESSPRSLAIGQKVIA